MRPPSSSSSSPRSFRYRAYGLNIDSSMELPELPPGQEPVDITIRRGVVPVRPKALDEHGAGIWVGNGQACHYRRDAGAFLVTEGREIVAEPCSSAAPEVVRLAILGPALGLALHQRGTFALHGSSVALGEEGAVVFLGPSGAGKSTMAALLHARGYRLLSDDVTALERADDGVVVIPSFPQIKLWPDAAEAIAGTADGMPVLHPGFDKRAFRPSSGIAIAPTPLCRIYLLAIEPEVRVRTVPALGAYKHLMAHWYGMRFGSGFLRSVDQARHFLSCAELARAVPMRILGRPATLNRDPNLAARIEAAVLDDVRSDSA